MRRPNLYENPLNAAEISNPTIPDNTQRLKRLICYSTIVATLHDFVLCTFTALPFSPTRAQKHTSTSCTDKQESKFDPYSQLHLCLQYQTNTEYTEADTLIVVFLSIIRELCMYRLLAIDLDGPLLTPHKLFPPPPHNALFQPPETAITIV